MKRLQGGDIGDRPFASHNHLSLSIPSYALLPSLAAARRLGTSSSSSRRCSIRLPPPHCQQQQPWWPVTQKRTS